MSRYFIGMMLLVQFIIALALIGRVTADIEINTDTAANECLQGIKNTPTTHKPYIVNGTKCCEVGKNLNLAEENDTCVKGDRTVSLDVYHMPDKNVMSGERIGSINITTNIGFPEGYTDTNGPLILNTYGELGMMKGNCTSILWFKDFCVDYDVQSDKLVGLVGPEGQQTIEKFDIEKYILLPCSFMSILALLVVIIVYWWVPAQHNLTEMALIGLAGCMLVMYSFFILHQYSNPSDDISVIEIMEDISNVAYGLWFLLLWCSTCSNALYYLPRNANMSRQLEQILCTCFALFGVVLLFTNRLLLQSVLLFVIMGILIVCGIACLLSCVGFHLLKKMIAKSFESNNGPDLNDPADVKTFNSTEIDKARTMYDILSYLMRYEIICFGIKYLHQQEHHDGYPAFGLFRALTGVYVCFIFLHYQNGKLKPKTEIEQQHSPNNTETETE